MSEYFTQRTSVTFASTPITTNFALTQPTVFGVSAAKDFSDASGQNGVWSYGYEDSTGSALILFNVTDNQYAAEGHYMIWTSSGDDLGGARMNEGDTPLDEPSWTGDFYFWPEMMSVEAGNNGVLDVVRWTAPVAGSYLIDAFFTPQQVDGANASVYVLHNNVEIFSGGVNGFFGKYPDLSDRTGTYDATYYNTLTLNQGDTIDFGAYDNGISGNDDNVAVWANVVLASGYPIIAGRRDRLRNGESHPGG